MWDGVMLPGEWLASFRMSTEDFVNLAKILTLYSFDFASSVSPYLKKSCSHEFFTPV